MYKVSPFQTQIIRGARWSLMMVLKDIHFNHHETTRSITTPPEWDNNRLQITSKQHFFRSFDMFAGTDSNFWVKRGTVGGSELSCPV